MDNFTNKELAEYYGQQAIWAILTGKGDVWILSQIASHYALLDLGGDC